MRPLPDAGVAWILRASVYILHVAVHFVGHPIAQDALTALRNRTTAPSRFRRLAHRLSLVVALEATRDLPLVRSSVDTPMEPAEGSTLAGDLVVVTVLRAGLGMLDAVLDLLPDARVGHIGLERDERTAVAARCAALRDMPGSIPETFQVMANSVVGPATTTRHSR